MAGPEKNSSLVSQVTSEVAPETSPLLNFLVKNRRVLGLALLVLVLAMVGYGVYTWRSGKQLAASQAELGRILVMASDTERLAKLKAFAVDAPSSMRDGLQLAIARSASLAKDYPAAVAAWDTLTKNPNAAVYAVAIVGKAENLILQNRDADALAVLLGAVVQNNMAASNLINSLVVDLAEKLGDYPKAIAASEKLVTGSAAGGVEEANFWRQKAASLRLAQAEQQQSQEQKTPAEATTPASIDAAKK